MTYPKLRDDLVIRRQDSPEGPCFVLKDPRNGAFFRLRETEYSTARRLDGATPLEGVAAGLAELGIEATAADVQPFVAQLERRGLLESSATSPANGRRLVRGTILWLRLAAFDPDRFLMWLAPKVRFLFTSWFVAGSAALIAWTFVATYLNRFDIADDIAILWRIESLLLLWVAVLSATALHELSHGLTCKHFGGEVREMGFLLIYFQPALYCNISDTYLFPERSRRLWVTAAGAYCDLFLWGLATLAWRVLERGTWPASLALVVMASAGIRTFFNLNPLIKLDGYYLLTDLLGIPNLRPRAFSYLGSLLKRFVGASGAEVAPSPRERRIFLVYGVLAAAFSYWLLTHLLLLFGRFLVSKYQGWGFVMITLLTIATFARPLRAVLPKVRRKRPVLLLLTAAFAGFLFVPLPLTVSGEFELLPGENADVRARIEGVIDEICVDEGDRVAADAVIARISDRSLKTRLAVVDALIGEREAQLRLLRAGTRPEAIACQTGVVANAERWHAHAQGDLDRMEKALVQDLAALDERISEAELQRERADSDYARVEALSSAEVATREELEKADHNRRIAQVRVLVAKADRQARESRGILEAEQELSDREKALGDERSKLALMEAGARPEEIAAMEQQIASARAERAQIEEDIACAVVKTPHGGIVTTPRVREKLGEHVAPGDLIAEVHAVETMTAEVKVSEKEIGDVYVGMPVTLRFRAFPDRTFTGTVAAPAPAALDVGSRDGRIVRVPIEVENPEGILRPNLTGYARMDAGKRRAGSIVTRRLRRFVRLEFWSWW